MRLFITLLPVFLFLWAGTVHAQEESTVTVSFLPQWAPQAQFAGYYTAYEKGFYAREGLDVTLSTGGPKHPSDRSLLAGESQFATLWLSRGIQLRSEGHDIVNIAQMIQRSALMLVAKKASGIWTPADLNGRKVSLWGPLFQIQPNAFFRRRGISVHVAPQSSTINLFLKDGVHAASAMWYNEYHTLLNSGLNPDELTTFFFHEYGLNFPEDGIYTTEKMLYEHPLLCRAFVRASLEGWRYAFAHREESLDIVLAYMKRAHIPASRVHQSWMLSRILELMAPDGNFDALGRLSQEDFERVTSVMTEEGLIRRAPEYSVFHRSFCERD